MPLSSTILRTHSFERILLIKPSAVGDVIHTLPVLVKLRARYPQARIDWLLTPEIAELVGNHPALSGIILFERNKYAQFGRNWPATAALFGLIRTIWGNRYDLIIDLHGQFRSALLTLASGARTRIGFDRTQPGAVQQYLQRVGKKACLHGWTGAREGAWLAYTHRLPLPTLDVHAADRYLWIGPMLGLDQASPDFTVPVPPRAEARIEEILKLRGLEKKPFAVLVPGTIWETKHWLWENFAEVGRHLQSEGLEVILAGSPREKPRCRQVASACPGAVDLCGQTTLSELAALLQRTALAVTNDSGSMHLTVALNKPVVSIFGPTDPIWIGPYGRPHAVVQAGVACAPCNLKKLNACPHDHACMKQVSPALVKERIRQVLHNFPTPFPSQKVQAA